MIEQKLSVGRYINWGLPPGSPTTIVPGTFITQGRIPMTITESTGFLTKTSNAIPGMGIKLHRNFQWLHWLPGAISQVEYGDIDVLTGPMSGCWITRYQIGEDEYIGHVGTDTNPESPNSVAAKTAWNAFARANPQNVFGGFKPQWTGPLPANVKGDSGGVKIFGLVADKKFYTVFTYTQLTQGKLRIAGFIPQNSVSLATLQNLP